MDYLYLDISMLFIDRLKGDIGSTDGFVNILVLLKSEDSPKLSQQITDFIMDLIICLEFRYQAVEYLEGFKNIEEVESKLNELRLRALHLNAHSIVRH